MTNKGKLVLMTKNFINLNSKTCDWRLSVTYFENWGIGHIFRQFSGFSIKYINNNFFFLSVQGSI